MKSNFFRALAVLSLVLFTTGPGSHATTTIYSLNSSGFPGGVFNGVDGWVQSEANFSEDSPRSYVQPFSGGVTGFSVGGFYDTEPFTGGDRMSLLRSLGGQLARGAGLGVSFQLLDSEVLLNPASPGEGYFDTDRNQFSLGFRDLVSVVFRPVSQSADPGTDAARWNPFISVGGELRPFAGAQLQEDGLYSLNLSITSVTNGLNYIATLTDLAGTSLASSGAIPGSSTLDPLTDAEVAWILSGGEADGLGSNVIAISSMAVTVPEPSLSVLCVAALLPFFSLRRRQC